jgi:hypothetical protein
MQLPDYWLQRPALPIDDNTRQQFDDLYQQILDKPQQPLSYTLSAPKWQFLCYLAEKYQLAMHGSGNPSITRFETRQANDISAFGNQKAVYAASDGIWAMFFAVVDRDRYAMSVSNACIHVVPGENETPIPYYFFSISKNFLPQKPWREGTVYVLPAQTFITQSPAYLEGVEIRIAQLASFVEVEPLARLVVTPEDFPFLEQIRGHDDARLAEYAQAMQTGAPLPD